MDEDNMVIKSRILQGIIEQSLERYVYRATGAKVKFRFTGPITATVGETAKIHVDLDVNTDKNGIDQLMKNRG